MYIVYCWPHSYIPPYASNIELVAYAFFVVGMACLESTWHLLNVAFGSRTSLGVHGKCVGLSILRGHRRYS